MCTDTFSRPNTIGGSLGDSADQNIMVAIPGPLDVGAIQKQRVMRSWML